MTTPTHDTPTPQDDLAYLKSLVAGDRGAQAGRMFGQVYFWAGILYGLQTLVLWAQGAGLITIAELPMLIFIVGVSVVFLALVFWLSWKNRNISQGSINNRAVGAVFGATGLANLVLIAAIGYRAYVDQSLETWLIYPIVVFVLQGAAWLASFMLMRRAWHGFVALGWFATSLAMSVTVGDLNFAVVVGIALILFMALPGYVMMRHPRA